jgi:hypothetical protein
MDGSQLDPIVRGWVTGGSRRRALRGLAGGALGGLLARLGVAQEVAADCRRRLRRCERRSQCCGSGAGRTACRELHPMCQAEFPGERCCGLEGARCNPLNEGCDCCRGLLCGTVGSTTRCLEPPP